MGDVWMYYNKEPYIVGITTNGTVKRNGSLVMGRGVAEQARNSIPNLDFILGTVVQGRGNHVYDLSDFTLRPLNLFSFPVKHLWSDVADLSLIRRSAQELSVIAIRKPDKIFLLPVPGTGNGRLRWSAVKNAIDGVFPSNVTLITVSPTLYEQIKDES